MRALGMSGVGYYSESPGRKFRFWIRQDGNFDLCWMTDSWVCDGRELILVEDDLRALLIERDRVVLEARSMDLAEDRDTEERIGEYGSTDVPIAK